MIQMRADVAKREAYIRTLESARDKLTQSIEDVSRAPRVLLLPARC